ncbi:hypothetical protein [Mariniflexile sp. HMF6888]|uniref:hypothetical protein n=1 Tax=Mariniflexile sp. HMF6888 TaxID=3373086 RepID=UPI0037ABD157
MTQEEYMEKHRNSKFAKLNREQRAKCVPIITKIMILLNRLYLEEIEVIMESLKGTFKESSQYIIEHIAHRDKED